MSVNFITLHGGDIFKSSICTKGMKVLNTMAVVRIVHFYDLEVNILKKQQGPSWLCPVAEAQGSKTPTCSTGSPHTLYLPVIGVSKKKC